MEKHKTVPIYYMHIVATARAPTHMKNYLLKLKTGPTPSMHCVQERHLIVMLVVMKFVLSLQKKNSPVIFRNDNSL